MASNASWMKERDAKNRQKQIAAGQDHNEHSEWMQQRDNIAKKKEEAELKAKQEEENKPEFLKNLQHMKENAQNKPKKKADEGPTIEELDDGTDIPPWHRPGAPEKPEWVILLLEAAKKEAEEDGEEDEHVFVAPIPSLAPKQKQSLPPKEPDQGKPEWMKQASLRNLKRASGAPAMPQKPHEAEETTQQPWMKHILKPSASPQTSKPTRSAPTLGDQPEWMQKRNQMNASMSSIGYTQDSLGDSLSSFSSHSIHSLPNRAKAKTFHESFSGTTEKPEWMKGAALLKKKNSMEDSNSSISSLNLPGRSWTANDSFSGTEKPEWMKSAALLKKKKSQDSAKQEAKAADESKEEQKPWLMRGKLKPRVNPEDLKASKVQEQLQNKPQLRTQPLISKDDLKTNIVQEKLKKRLPLKKPSMDISRDELESSKVRAKLASRPVIADKKAPVKKEEMEWMKKKLKPRVTTSSEIPDQSTKSTSDASAAKEKPDWMKRASNVQAQKSKEENKTNVAEKPSDEHQEEKPWLMRNKLKAAVSPEDLRSSKVQEKLANKPELKKSPVPVTSQQLQTSQVQEKLSQRTGVPRKKSGFKGEELEWMKNKLRPRAPGESEITALEAKDNRPSWMKELKKKNSKNDNDADAGAGAKAGPKEVGDEKMEAPTDPESSVKGAITATPSDPPPAEQKSKTSESSSKVATATSQSEESKAEEQEPELDQDDLMSGEKERDILGILQGMPGASKTVPSVESTDLIANERFWSSLADFGTSAKNDSSDSDDSDGESVTETSISSEDFLTRPSYPRPTTTPSEASSLLSMPKSSKDAKKAKSRSRSSSLDRQIKKKKKEKKEKKKKKKDKEKDGDAKKKKKKEKRDKDNVSKPSD